jgi:hypothetical protein
MKYQDLIRIGTYGFSIGHTSRRHLFSHIRESKCPTLTIFDIKIQVLFRFTYILFTYTKPLKRIQKTTRYIK